MLDPEIKEELASYRSRSTIRCRARPHAGRTLPLHQGVGVLKAKHQLPPADPAREEYQIERLRHLAKDANLDPDFAEKFLNFIIKEVIRHHEAIAADCSQNAGSAGTTHSA